MENKIVLVTGMSGAGKSSAMNALEDLGYYCMDNFPKELLDNLDSDTEEEIIEILKTSAHKHGKCVIVVTHSKELAKKSDVILVLKNKKLTM